MVKAETKQKENVMAISPKDLGITVKKSTKDAQTAFAQWIRSLLQNWRQGTVGCKGRSDVARTGKKPFKQKGTGRARAGTARSPLWRGGGVIFGPQPRTRQVKITKGMKKSVFNALLENAFAQGKLLSFDLELSGDKPQTSAAFSLIKQAGLVGKKILVFVPTGDLLSYASLRNLPNVRLVYFDQANAFDLAKSDYWVFLKKDLDQFKEMVSRWT